jgi:uncharacterized protein YndB with AHSA1/START domain
LLRSIDGRILNMAERTRGYAHRVDIMAEGQRVWRALTDPACLARWCAPDARIRPYSGGSFRASVDRVTELEAHIDVFEAGRRMRLIFLPSATLPATDSAIVTDFILEALPAGTIVRVLGSGVPGDEAWDTQYKRLRAGWERAMARLKVFVEKGLDR